MAACQRTVHIVVSHYALAQVMHRPSLNLQSRQMAEPFIVD